MAPPMVCSEMEPREVSASGGELAAKASLMSEMSVPARKVALGVSESI